VSGIQAGPVSYIISGQDSFRGIYLSYGCLTNKTKFDIIET